MLYYLDYTFPYLTVKEQLLKILSKYDSKVKCAMVVRSESIKIKLPCGYNSREFLKFILQLEYPFIGITCRIWFEDGTSYSSGYGVGEKRIPNYLKRN